MYGKLFASMYEGTLYGQWQAIITLQQLVVLADEMGVVDMTPPAIAARTSIPLEIIEVGLTTLQNPDPYSRSPGEEGRRLVLIDDSRPWGWRIVNYRYYRDLANRDDKRRKDRERLQALQQAKKADREEEPDAQPDAQFNTDKNRRKSSPRKSMNGKKKSTNQKKNGGALLGQPEGGDGDAEFNSPFNTSEQGGDKSLNPNTIADARIISQGIAKIAHTNTDTNTNTGETRDPSLRRDLSSPLSGEALVEFVVRTGDYDIDDDPPPPGWKPKPCKPKAVLALYNAICTKLVPAKALNSTREKWIRARWKEHWRHHDLSWWEGYFRYIQDRNPFLAGYGPRGWTANFDFVVGLKGFTNIVDGYYEDGKGVPNGPRR